MAVWFAAWTLVTGGELLAALPPASGPTQFVDDDAFLEYVQRQTFNFFWNEANTNNGLIRDRSTASSPCSIASIGFGLSALNIAVERGWISRPVGRARTLLTLQTLANAPQGSGSTGCAGYRGWFYHFLDMTNGLRFGSTELSTIDTALLLLGIIDAGQYFDDPVDAAESQIRELADGLVNRVDWPFVLRTNDQAVTMQWTPEGGYSAGGWVGYSEASCMYLLGLGAATNPLPAVSWNAWTSGYSWVTAYGQSFVACPPLFTHQYSQAWIDFRFIADAFFRAKGSDYFENSRRATLAQQQYASRNPLGFPNYSFNEWGFTACDGPNKTVNGTLYIGYAARGVPNGLDDGTLAPTAVLGSLPFAPEVCLPTARHFYDAYRTNIWTAEGFRDAYNIKAGWWDGDTIGIDEGPIVVMIENYRTGAVWRRMMRSPHIQRGLARAGFTAPPPERVTAKAVATNQILVSWSGPASYQTGFQVLTSLDGITFTVAATVAATNTSTLLDAAPKTTYFIRVIATNEAGLSRPRQTISVITPATNPLPEVRLQGSDEVGTSSLESAGHWSDGTPPSENKDYQVGGAGAGGEGFTLRTPADAISREFGGHSLTVGDGNSHSPANQLWLAGWDATNTFPDLRFDGGALVHGSPGARLTLAGVVSVQNVGVRFEQGAFSGRHLRIGAALQGGGPVAVTQWANGATSAMPTYDGCVEFHGSNVYLGPTSITGTALVGDTNTQLGPATLQVRDLGNGGEPSHLGRSSSDRTNLWLNAGVLRYVGAGSTSDRLFTVGQLGAGLEASGTGPLNLTNRGFLGLGGVGARTLLLAGTNSAANTLAAAIGDYGGATAILKTNAGTWVLAGANSYSGLTTVADGTLVLNGSTPAGNTAAVNLEGGTLVLSNGVVGSSVVVSGGDLRFLGSGATNVIGGPITVTGLALSISSPTGRVAEPATLLVAGGIAAPDRNLEIRDDLNGEPGQIWLVGKPINLGSGELVGYGVRIGVAGNVVGTIHPCYGHVLTLETNNAFSGTPALYLGNPGWGRLDLNGHSLIVGRFTNSSTMDVVTSLYPATLMVASASANSFSGELSGPGLALTKTGGGTLALSGKLTYAGPTTLLSGTLALSAAPGESVVLAKSGVISLANRTVLDVSGVASGFSLGTNQMLKGNGAINGVLTVAAGATLAAGDPAVAGINSLLFKQALNLSAGSTTAVHVTRSPFTNDVISVQGTLSLGGTLVVHNIGPTPLAALDNYSLFKCANVVGQFSGIVPVVPGAGLVWDTARLGSEGILGVALAIPRITSLELQSTQWVLAGSGGWPSAPFHVVGATNLGIPLDQWQRVASDHFDSRGTFTLSNGLDPGWPQAFYRLESP